MRRRTRPELTIVLVSWNTRGVLERCLTSLHVHTRRVSYEVVVVDNASSDGTVDALRAHWPHVRLVENSENVGFARGCNQGLAAARGDFILLLNTDTYVEDDAIGTMVRFMRARPDVAMSGCRMLFPDGRLQHTAARSLSIWRSLFEDLWVYKLVPERRRNAILLGGFWQPDREMDVDWLAGVFMLLPRETYLTSGGFDEDFHMYGEDAEWCMRLRRRGLRIVYTPDAVVYHEGSVSSDLRWSSRDRLRRCHLGGVEAYAKVNGRRLAAAYAAAKSFGSGVRCLAYAALAVATRSEYYRSERSLRGWQARDYAEGLVRLVMRRTAP
ncbi:MAG: glycosyltransferase family 2 protein [Gemmatimonadetes bacterium]|nr:glycosyltransferase family 2 protein [Gemmatimonadota bacterium]